MMSLERLTQCWLRALLDDDDQDAANEPEPDDLCPRALDLLAFRDADPKPESDPKPVPPPLPPNALKHRPGWNGQ